MAVLCAELLFSFRRQRGQFLRVVQQQFAMRGERNAPRGTIEETHAEIILQGLDLKCHGRLGKKKMFGSTAKIQLFGNGAKYLEAEILKLGHWKIMHVEDGIA